MTPGERIEVDGNDGTGKSTLVALLEQVGIRAKDRGDMTEATDHPEIRPRADTVYLLLDAPVATCQERLRAAGKDLSERYHTERDLSHYRQRFLDVAARFGARVIPACTPRVTLQAAIAAVVGRELTVGIPKGRLQENVVALLRRAGFEVRVEARKYTFPSQGFEGILLKPRSIPQLVALGFIDVGFSGRDILLDSIYENLVELADTRCNPVRLLAAAPSPEILTAPPPRPLVVATEFPNLVDRWLTGEGLAHIILHASGGTEAYAPRFADLIVDVVETGETLRANGLTPIHDFGESTTLLLTRREIAEQPSVRAFAATVAEAVESH